VDKILVHNENSGNPTTTLLKHFASLLTYTPYAPKSLKLPNNEGFSASFAPSNENNGSSSRPPYVGIAMGVEVDIPMVVDRSGKS
jgi:hypothetical protein